MFYTPTSRETIIGEADRLLIQAVKEGPYKVPAQSESDSSSCLSEFLKAKYPSLKFRVQSLMEQTPALDDLPQVFDAVARQVPQDAGHRTVNLHHPVATRRYWPRSSSNQHHGSDANMSPSHINEDNDRSYRRAVKSNNQPSTNSTDVSQIPPIFSDDGNDGRGTPLADTNTSALTIQQQSCSEDREISELVVPPLACKACDVIDRNPAEAE